MDKRNTKDRKKILIIRLSSMGDVVLTGAIPRIIKKKHPDALLHFLTNKQFTEVLKHNPYINKVLEYRKSDQYDKILATKQNLLNELGSRYDLIIDLQKNLRSKMFRQGLGRRYSTMKKNRWRKIMLVNFHKNLYKEIEAIPDLYRRATECPDDGEALELWTAADLSANKYSPGINSDTRDCIALAPGAFHNTKQWPSENFAELATSLLKNTDNNIMLLGGPKDKSTGRQIAEELPPDRVINNTGAKSILFTAEQLDRCRLLITNDTGVMHIAAARQVPIVAIFGSTVLEFGFGPYRVPHHIVQKALPCRPCTHIGLAECPKKHLDCLNKISADEVYEKALELLEETGSGDVPLIR